MAPDDVGGAGGADRYARSLRRNLRTLAGLVLLFAAITALYSVLFHVVMHAEGRSWHWFTGFYWTIETMSTLGYGDIVFQSTAGRLFAVVVVGTGILFLLILLPFSFVQFFYVPWLEARNAARVPRVLPPGTTGHVILTDYGPVEAALIRRLVQFRLPYVVIEPDVAVALGRHDEGLHVLVGDRDDPDTYRRARVGAASLVAATLSDTANANVVLTVREVSETVPIVATAAWESSAAMLERAGCQQVVQLGDLLGRSMARRLSGHAGGAHVLGEVDDLLVAEAPAMNTALVGHTLRDLRLRERLNVNVAGTWQRGRYTVATAEARVTADSLLLLVGTRAALDAFDREVRLDVTPPRFVLVVGGGRVGRATSKRLVELGIEHKIVERRAERVSNLSRYVIGDATDFAVLREADIDRAESVAITTHDDDVNVYVTLACHRLRPDIPIVSRATLERNVSTLYRAGADTVLSYVPMEANAIFDVIRRGNLLLAAEGLDIFTVTTPRPLVGRTIATCGLREDTGCNLLAVRRPGASAVLPDPDLALTGGTELMLIGDRAAEQAFFDRYGNGDSIGRRST
ncbi:MAG: NAD-binding protein [Vicinamibacterales bacterium]